MAGSRAGDLAINGTLLDPGHKGGVDPEASETAVRTAMHKLGGRLLEGVSNAD